jgi:protein ImuA
MSLGGAQERAACLRKQFSPLASFQGRSSQTISVFKEIDAALPWHGLPLGCVHEVQSVGLAGAIAFASLLAARLPTPAGQMVYVSSGRGFHAIGLLPFGIQPERWIHVSARCSQDLAWATLEALRCARVGVVLSELRAADLTLCRRFQLAAEENGATCFLLNEGRGTSAIASVITRWQIVPRVAPSRAAFDEPYWDLALSYCRGGQPGHWDVAWRNAQMQLVEPASPRASVKPAESTRFTAATRLAG